MWAGLGYYSRARNLHACAKVVVERYDGRFPRREAELIELPGVGPYTAAAIAAIAFGERASPVDGNIERVVSRLFAVREPLPLSKPALRSLAATLTPSTRTGDFAQAMMDLGAKVCTPKRPSCLMCPLHTECTARALGIEASLPARTAEGRAAGAVRHRVPGAARGWQRAAAAAARPGAARRHDGGAVDGLGRHAAAQRAMRCGPRR